MYDLNLESAEMSKPPSNDSPKNILNVINNDCIALILENVKYQEFSFSLKRLRTI